ncbi:unnamed protein product [Moneuplotes crassus]|uniref:COPI associated protein n=1 Tax=Euplotes crassus TaxID=5936 RepID=A0AAD2D1R7_EUPCR|nr:unnamed protein product [Moneuplotes crassus]
MQVKQLTIAEIESKVIFLKLASGVIAGIILFFSFFNFLYGLDYYMQTVASGYLTLFCAVIILSEFSPSIFENYILKCFPFLQYHSGRGIFYMILGTFCLDSVMGYLVFLAGIGLVACGILYIIAFFLIDTQTKSQVQRENNAADGISSMTPGNKDQVPSDHGYYSGNNA